MADPMAGEAGARTIMTSWLGKPRRVAAVRVASGQCHAGEPHFPARSHSSFYGRASQSDFAPSEVLQQASDRSPTAMLARSQASAEALQALQRLADRCTRQLQVPSDAVPTRHATLVAMS